MRVRIPPLAPMEFENVNQKLMDKYDIDPACGCECPPGWFKLVDQLLSDLFDIEGFHPDMIGQIKSKFCGLRVYLDGIIPEEEKVNQLVREAEAKSYETCELCGGPPADKDPVMWGMRLCDPCQEHKEAYRTRRL